MLTSLALILLLGFFGSAVAQRLHLPGLLGMLLAGILLGPSQLNLLSPPMSFSPGRDSPWTWPT